MPAGVLFVKATYLLSLRPLVKGREVAGSVSWALFTNTKVAGT